MAEPVIELTDVCFSYGSEEVLHNVSFTIHPRDFVAIVGPNGGGKTTLLKLMLGALEPDFGRVRVMGGAPESAKQRLGYVPQHLNFDPDFPVTVRDVALMGRSGQRRFGPYRRSDHRAVAEALDRVDLEEKSNAPFSELSGGERQRVLIAQALSSEPEALLLDEPTASVDAVVERHIYDLLRQLNERLTIVVVSHNLNVVTRHATHVACVNRTATLNPVDELTPEALDSAYGGDMAILRHADMCHVFDPSGALRAPHRAAPGGQAGEGRG